MDVNLTREQHIDKFTGPTGRVFGVRHVAANEAFFEIHYSDGRSGDMPDSFINHRFTKRQLAEVFIKNRLAAQWDEAEKATRNRSKSA